MPCPGTAAAIQKTDLAIEARQWNAHCEHHSADGCTAVLEPGVWRYAGVLLQPGGQQSSKFPHSIIRRLKLKVKFESGLLISEVHAKQRPT